MPRYAVAHVREQGVQLIIVPVDDAYGRQPESDQADFHHALQIQARRAGLAGTVVPVWADSRGRMSFRAPQNWHPFFRGLSLPVVYQNLTKEIYW
jgi:hypothetical protein